MSGKLKGLFAVLGLSALAALVFVVSLAGGDSSPRQRQVAAIAAPVTDTDADGLADSEENYWKTDFRNPDSDGDGFKDGEEVLSGHNPAKAGPDDALNRYKNVTEQAGALLAGALAAGDLNPNDPDYQAAIEHLAKRAIEQFQENAEFVPDSFKQGKSDHDSVLNYGFTTARLIRTLFSQTSDAFVGVVGVVGDVEIYNLSKLKETDAARYEQFVTAIDAEIASLEIRIAEVKEVPVPPSMADAHRNILLLLRGTQQQYRLLRQLNQDPMQGVLALQTINELVTTSALDITHDFSGRLNEALRFP
jgi:hypothetical protein